MNDKLTEARKTINEIDAKMAELFIERMKAAELVAEHKMEHGLPIFDPVREAEVIKRNSERVEDETYREYYVSFQKSTMEISKAYQARLIEKTATGAEKCEAAVPAPDNVNVLNVELGNSSYPIIIGKGLLERVGEFFDLGRKVFIITDDGVPHKYAETVEKICKNAIIKTVRSGEGSKSFQTLEDVLRSMSDFRLTRRDCVIAVGGGVVGDLAGFAASVYMRGIDFYNIPTTLLSQVDSSIGGKTAINLDSVKNSVGSFKQPRAVLIDVDTLATLPERQMQSGLCEAVKMAATADKELFEKFEALDKDEIYNNIVEIITAALKIKKAVVEEDEEEKGLRRILNFGHTLGHAIESAEGLSGLYHGECVALGMLAISESPVRDRLYSVLKKIGLPTEYAGDIEHAFAFLTHDKKCIEDGVSVVLCPEIGHYEIKDMSLDDFKKIIKK